jgi:hypothetical protein
MKKQLFMVLFGMTSISLTGCYTQVAVEENDDSYIYQEPVPVIIYYPVPVPEPVFLPAPTPPPPKRPEQPIYKDRKPETPPKSKDRVRDDIRNSGGRNESGRTSRR